MKLFTPPTPVVYQANLPSIFLAGSIEGDTAPLWQDRLIYTLKDLDCIILNPRRPDWDETWTCEATNLQFRQQVEWELNGLRDADLIAMYLAPGTVSPISLLELGLHMHESMMICCPPGFARKGNVDVTAGFYGVNVWDNWDEWVEAVRAKVIRLRESYGVLR